jgi:hypothetical protein
MGSLDNTRPYDAVYKHPHRGVFSFGRKILAPGERHVAEVVFEVPFRLLGLTASPVNASDIVLTNIIVGDRRLIIHGGSFPVEMFVAGFWPFPFGDVDVPMCVPLRVEVLNTSDDSRTFLMGCLGIGFSNLSRDEIEMGLEEMRLGTRRRAILRRLRRHDSWIWTLVVVPFLRVLHWLKGDA